MRDPRRDGPPPGPFGWPGIGRYLRGPEGLSRLSTRRRDVAIRWLGFAASVATIAIIFLVLVLARHPAT